MLSLRHILNLHKIFLIALTLIFFHILAPQSNAFQPSVGSWAFVGLNNYIIHSIAVDPNSPNILYAGTHSFGIFKSTDGGGSWNAINNGITNHAGYFTEIVVDPTNSNIVYAGGVGVDDGNTGILKSTDGGASWVYAHNGITDVGFGGPPADVNSMIIDPNNPTILYVAIGNRCGAVYKSTDSAATWSRTSGLACDPTVIRIDPFNSNVLYTRTGWGQGINNSVDGGLNWSNISSFGANSGFFALAIDPFGSNNLYANDNTGVYKSTDSGLSWSLSSGALNNVYKALVGDPVRPNTVYAGEDAGIETSAYMTTNGGSTWTNITNGLPDVGVKRLLVSASDPNILYAGTEAGIYAYGLVPNNQSPVIGTFTVPTNPVIIDSNVNISTTFSDPNINDTHTAVWNWGDNTTSTGTVTESNGSGTASGVHTYTTAGVYTVGLTVIDNHNTSANATYEYVVVYDPSAGFLTVGGQYDSQAGWDIQNPSAVGKVILGISAKYIQNNTAPTGNAKVNFKVGDINFTANSYQWLVVNSSKAYLMGSGTINGSGNYTIFVSAIDGSQTGGQNLIRVQLKDSSTQSIIYDTQPGQSEIVDPTTPVINGSVKVH